jgi:RNA recognition motif-containing protein
MMKLYIGNLSYDTTEQELREALTDYEPVVEIRRPLDRETGEPRGFAFVTFGSREAGEKALKSLDGMKLGGRELRVNEAEERRQQTNWGPREPRVSMDLDNSRRVDDRPLGPDGKRIRYKGI